MVRMGAGFMLAVLLTAAPGCGDDRSPDVAPAPVAASPAAVPAAPDMALMFLQDGRKTWVPGSGTAEISGTVKFGGAPPRRRRVDMGVDENCTKMHAKPMLDETVIVNKDGTLRNVFVWIRKGLEGWTFEPPAEPVVLDQVGCCYSPHVFGIMAGQELKIRNGDDTLHNIHALPRLNSEWNFGQPKKGMEESKRFANPEVLVKFKCDVHGWMHAYAGVTWHPFHAVTGEEGTFRIAGLPPGEYAVEAVHEKFGAQAQTVKVGDKESKQVSFSYEGK